MPLLRITTNADRIPLSASSFSSSVSSSCRTPKMYVPYTSRSTSNESKRSFNQLSNSPVSVMGAAILALWDFSMVRGCPVSMPEEKRRNCILFDLCIYCRIKCLFKKTTVVTSQNRFIQITAKLVICQFILIIVIHV